MNNFELPNWIPMAPALGPPLPRFLNIYWPWYKAPPEVITGFKLRIINAPAGAALWNASFAEKSFEYEPMADSGWLGIDEVWEYPSDPRGVTTLRVWMLDAKNNVLLDIGNLGPVNSGKDYIFDCSTKILRET